MKNESHLQYLRRKLSETVGQHNQIAKRSKVPQSTISRIHLGAVPRLDTASKLIKYFQNEAKK
jgi:predicted transcriptional regulator